MKRMIQGFLLAGSLVVGGSALAQTAQGSATGTNTGTTTAKGGTVEYMGFRAPADEKAFLERLHQINQREIQAGKLTQQNSQNADVKSFGDMLVRDHTSADQQVLSFAQRKGLKLAEPKPMDEVERKAQAAAKADSEKLQVLKGEPFDSYFLASMVAGHDEALGKLMAGQQGITDTELSPLLQQISQSVAQHRQQAYSLLGRVGPGARAGVGGAGVGSEDTNKDMNKGAGTGGAGDRNKGTQSGSDKNTMDPGNQKTY